MINYHYKGITHQGKRVSGDIQAENERDLEQRLASAEIDILSFKEKKQTLFSTMSKKKITKRDVILVTAQIRQLLRAGITLMEIIDDLRSTFENDSIKEILANVYESMEGGDSFSEALKPYEGEFGKVYISMVAVGERTGQLDLVLKNLEDMLKWEENLASKAKKVMIYPAIVGFVVIMVVVLLMLFVVPELLGFIKEMGGELGFATLALIATSNFVEENILLLIVSPFIISFLFKQALRRYPSFRFWYDRNIFNISIFGPILYNLKIARFTNSLAVMYSAGLGFIESTQLASAVVGNKYIEGNIERSIRLIEEGAHINVAFAEAEVLPLMATRMVKVGEVSGNMDEALFEVSEYYDTAAKESIEKIEPAIEPILTVIMGAVVGWVMMAVLGPVYETISKVQ